jgi:two-component system response regulator FlrC
VARILVVDDDDGVRAFLADSLSLAGHEVDQAGDGVEALERIAARAYPLVVTDLKMPRLDGLGLVDRIKKDHPETEVIVVTAHGSVDSAVDAMKRGAFDFVQKPLSSPDELSELAARALDRHRLAARDEVRRDGEPPPLTYGAPAMEPVVAALQKVAVTEATVLLLGESGTGKEVAARAIHDWSRRSGGPFVAINCAALSEALLESELFGHEKGAFTGAVARRRGRIELAAGGTFFLDEVGELKPDLQAKLLRVLQERTFERVGGNQTVEADVRWVAATNRKLEERVHAGAFREDLYYRLAVFPIQLPPLRERKSDIVPLARTLLDRVARSLGQRSLRLSEAAEAELVRRPWPGNVRELANAIERAAILADGGVLDARHFDLASPPRPPVLEAPGVPTMEEAEREAIERALDHYDGNRKRTAEHLGIGLRTLYEKLKRYGLG